MVALFIYLFIFATGASSLNSCRCSLYVLLLLLLLLYVTVFLVPQILINQLINPAVINLATDGLTSLKFSTKGSLSLPSLPILLLNCPQVDFYFSQVIYFLCNGD